MFVRQSLLIVASMVLLAAPGLTQVPTSLHYQGRLLMNTADQDAVGGTVDIVFSIWSEPTGGAQLWSESWTGVALSNGIFSVLLGSNGTPLDPADFQGDASLYLELVVDGETLLPRQQLGSAPFAMVDEPENELQDLALSADELSLSDSASVVDLSPYLDNTDEQTLSLSGNSLSISGSGSSVDLSLLADNTDEQDLSLSGNMLSLTGDASPVDLSGFLDNTDEQDLSLSGTALSLTGDASPVDLSGFLDNTDEQDLSLSGNMLSLTGDASPVDLSPYLDNTDEQTLSLSGTDLTISGSGSSVDLSPLADNTDEQDLSLSGTALSLTGDASPVDLSGFLDNTDAQTLGLVTDTLSISGSGSSVDLSTYRDNTDAQTLSLAGNTLSISGSGSTVDLATTDGLTGVEARLDALEDAVPQVRLVFVTAQLYDGDLGGLAGADAECQALADSAGLPGTYMAWLSDSTASPSTRFTRLGVPFERVDGVRIADDWDDLLSSFGEGGQPDYLQNPIDVNETGATVSGSPSNVWTGTDQDGTLNSPSRACSDWGSSSASEVGVAGRYAEVLVSWTVSFLHTCDQSFRLYCFGQTAELDVYGDNASVSDNQHLSIDSLHRLRLTSPYADDVVSLAAYLDNTDNQVLSLSGNSLQLTSDDGTDTVDLSGLANTAAQTLSISGDQLSISGSGSSVDLSPYLDNTDAQTLSLAGDSLSISGSGSSVDLSEYRDSSDVEDLRSLLWRTLEMTSRVVFVTSERYDGDLGGLTGADAECQALAEAAGLNGTYMAWLSDSTGSPATRFDLSGGPFVRLDGRVIADDWADLTDELLDDPIDLTELNVGDLKSRTWTSTTTGGAFTGLTHCNDWSGTGGTGSQGDTDRATGTWTAREDHVPCTATAPLYCFEQ